MTDNEDKEILIRYRLEQTNEALREAKLLCAASNTTLGAVNMACHVTPGGRIDRLSKQIEKWGIPVKDKEAVYV